MLRWRQWWRACSQICPTTEPALQALSSLPLMRCPEGKKSTQLIPFFVFFLFVFFIFCRLLSIVKDDNGCLDFCEFLMAAHCITSATPRWEFFCWKCRHWDCTGTYLWVCRPSKFAMSFIQFCAKDRLIWKILHSQDPITLHSGTNCTGRSSFTTGTVPAQLTSKKWSRCSMDWCVHLREVLKLFYVFATIYETEGLDHHMAVERAHVSIKDADLEGKHVVFFYWTIVRPGFAKLPKIAEYLWKIGCWPRWRHNGRGVHPGCIFLLKIQNIHVTWLQPGWYI